METVPGQSSADSPQRQSVTVTLYCEYPLLLQCFLHTVGDDVILQPSVIEAIKIFSQVGHPILYSCSICRNIAMIKYANLYLVKILLKMISLSSFLKTKLIKCLNIQKYSWLLTQHGANFYLPNEMMIIMTANNKARSCILSLISTSTKQSRCFLRNSCKISNLNKNTIICFLIVYSIAIMLL